MTTQTRQLALLAAVGVIVSVVVILYGYPESTPGQRIALELGALPLSVSLAAGNLILLERVTRQPRPRQRIGLIASWSLSGVGLLLIGAAYLFDLPGAVQFGQFLIFVGLLAVMLLAVTLRPATSRRRFVLDEVADPDQDPATP